VRQGFVLEQVRGELVSILERQIRHLAQDSASPSCLKEAGLSEDCKSEMRASVLGARWFRGKDEHVPVWIANTGFTSSPRLIGRR
jgi:hypothetical protein